MAGKAHVLAWCSAVSDALQDEPRNRARVLRLFEAALSVPIRLRLCPDWDACALALLQHAETAGAHFAASGADSFWVFAERVGRLDDSIKGNISSLSAKLTSHAITFKGKAINQGFVKALKALIPFVSDPGCKQAHLFAEPLCPELKDMTMLSKIARLCSKRSEVGGQGPASDCMAFIFDSFRAARLIGELPKGECTVNKAMGHERASAGWVHILLKKHDFIQFIMHEAELLDMTMVEPLRTFATPASILTFFAATGDGGLVDKFLKSGLAASGATRPWDDCFALKVAQHREAVAVDSPGLQLLMDMMWGTWSGAFEAEFVQLATRECQSGSSSFLWHCHLLKKSSAESELSLKYQAFLQACNLPATSAAATGASAQAGVGVSEMGESDERNRVQKKLLSLRRQCVNFVALQTTSIADESAQLNKSWDTMRLGLTFSKAKHERRALVFCADLFSPNLTKHGRNCGLSDTIAPDADRMRRTIDFMLQKRRNDDVVMIFDGRSKQCRKVIESFEDALAASGAYGVIEVWLVYVQPSKYQDPRVPGRNVNFAANNKEIALVALPKLKGARSKDKVLHRSEFNKCGETSTASSSYTGIQMRHFGEFPRMGFDTKVGILGSTATGVTSKALRLEIDINERGLPFSWAESKP